MLTLGSVEPGDPKIIEDELPDWWGGLPPFPQIKYQHPQNRLVFTGSEAFYPGKNANLHFWRWWQVELY